MKRCHKCVYMCVYVYVYVPPDPINRASLEAIETAQAVISLDRHQDTEEYSDRRGLKYWDEHKTMLANRYLHGNGSSQYSCSRWFDSAILVRAGLCWLL